MATHEKTRHPTPALPRSSNYYSSVYEAVRQIPFGKVSTYGDIAEFLSLRVSARMVGYALNAAAGSDVPCHRVVNRFGALTGRYHFGHPDAMADLLRAEGVRFIDDHTVDLSTHRYHFPRP